MSLQPERKLFHYEPGEEIGERTVGWCLRLFLAALRSAVLATVCLAHPLMIHAQESPTDEPRARADQSETSRREPFVEREEVEFVIVDVIVERKGPDGWKPASGFRKDQFRVLIGGIKASIDSFEERCGSQGSAKAASLEPSRYVLVFAESHLSLRGRNSAYRAAIRWAEEEARPTDEVMVISLGSRLKLLRRMVAASPSLAEDLEAAWQDLSNFNPGASGYGLRSMFEGLRDVMAVFDRLPGQKNMVFFANHNMLRAPSSHLRYVTEFAEAASDRDIRIYPVPPSGMGAWPSGAQTMLASETGGQVLMGTNRLGMVFDLIEDDRSCYYRLGFHLRQQHKGLSKNISIRVTGSPGRDRLYYRRMLRDPTPERRMIEALMSALLDPPASAEFPVSVKPFSLYPHPQRSRVRVQVSVSLEDLLALPAPEHGPGARTISLQIGGRLVPVADRQEDAGPTSRGIWADLDMGRRSAGFSGQVRLILPAERPGKTTPRRLIRVADLFVEPGSYRLVALIQDEHARSISTASADIHVDAAAEVLGPIALAVEDPLSLVVSKGSESDNGGSSRLMKKSAPPEENGSLLSRALLADSHSIGAGRDAYFVYGICDQKERRVSQEWEIARALECSNGTEPLVLSPRHAPELSRRSPCATLVDHVPADALSAGRCTFEVSLAPPGGSSLSYRRALELTVTGESRAAPVPVAAAPKGARVAPNESPRQQ